MPGNLAPPMGQWAIIEVMDGAGADAVIDELTRSGGIFGSEWIDPTRVATRGWRDGALDELVDPLLGSDGTILIELDLNHPHPEFYGIVRVDERGVWYADADGSVMDPAWRLRLLPWKHIDGMTLHQAS